jgi:uncharacterized protein (UPF0332 family)
VNAEVEALIRLAEESLAAAEILLKEGQVRFSISRSYCAMFYCAEALHLAQGRSFSRHGAVVGAFGQYFVKTGIFDERFHQYIRKAHQDRQRSDYDPLEVLTAEAARSHLQHSQEFLDTARAFLRTGRQP